MRSHPTFAAHYTYRYDDCPENRPIQPYGVAIGALPPFIGRAVPAMNSYPSFVALYDSEFANRLGFRAGGFRDIFRALEQMNRGYYRIIETGTLRQKDNWEGDGQSTLLFDRFVNFHDGAVFSIDLEPAAVAVARSLTSAKTHCICSDSVRFLRDFCSVVADDRRADLYYLDSFDFQNQDPHPSMLHHIMELLAIGVLNKGTIVAVDDNAFPNGEHVGKGKLVADYFARIGVRPIHTGYQMIWQI